MSVADSIERIVRHVLGNLEYLIVNRISSRARHPLLIENGAGASIKLIGDQVIINGITNGGGALGCLWESSGETAAEVLVQKAFKDDDDWGYFVGLEWAGDPDNGIPSGVYCHGYQPTGTNNGGTSLVSTDKLLPDNDLTQVLQDRHIILRFFRDEDYVFEEGWSLHYNWAEFEDPEYSSDPHVSMTLSNMDDSVHIDFEARDDTEFVYRATLDGVEDFPIIALKFGSLRATTETCFIEIFGVWQVSTSYVTNVAFNGEIPGYVYLTDPKNVDLQSKRLSFNSTTYIYVDDDGNITFHVPAGKGIRLEQGA